MKIETAMHSTEFQEVDRMARELYYEYKKGNAVLGVLIRIETQVVAGINYKMTYRAPDFEICTVIVYEDLQEKFQVSSMDCVDSSDL